jgi:hypothetical protein
MSSFLNEYIVETRDCYFYLLSIHIICAFQVGAEPGKDMKVGNSLLNPMGHVSSLFFCAPVPFEQVVKVFDL